MLAKKGKKKGKTEICTRWLKSGDSYLVLCLALSLPSKFLMYVFYTLFYCGYIQLKCVIIYCHKKI